MWRNSAWFLQMFNKRYDPSWLVESAKAVEAEYPWLSEALEKCTTVVSRTGYYIYFVNPRRPNQPGSEWQFLESVTLEGTIKGDVVLDLLKDQRVGGIELLSELIDIASST